MKGLLGAAALALCIAIAVLVPGYGAAAVLLCGALAAGALFAINRAGVDQTFLSQLFTIALLLRVTLGAGTFLFRLQEFFGGDAFTYDDVGYSLLKVWRGEMRYEV